MPPLKVPLEGKRFQLDSSGVAGFFGGDEAISAMATVHVYEGRKWLGWYNSPGSYTVAKRYGRLARSRFWSALFPGIHVDPVTLFGLSGCSGPQFTATHSGTTIADTEHAGHLFLKKCQSLPTKRIESRVTSSLTVTIVDLRSIPDLVVNAASSRGFSLTFLAVIPILASVGACVACGVFRDWYCCSMILLGILSSGVACFVIGSGTLVYTRPDSAKGSPKGDGYLHGSSELVALRGAEAAVSAITRGGFSLKFEGEPEYRAIGISSMLLTTQFLLQLLLIPQGTLFGQILFLSTLAISWLYNCYLSSLDREVIQAQILTKKVLKHPVMRRYQLGSRTAAVVFLALALQPPNPSSILDALLPSSATWSVWKRAVGEKIEKREQLLFDESDYVGVASDQRDLLEVLFSDATEAYTGYLASEVDMNEERLIAESKDSDSVVVYQ
jgi:hypothetical protein